ncbi:MAG: EAL domain-containing protein [Helicobacteraceae bacterium]|nr:EAL domain-containing protein [Helicobacteraceae bacterium]
MINYIETKQIKLYSLAKELNYNVQNNRANILEAIVNKSSEKVNIIKSFEKLKKNINDLDKFILDNEIQISEINKRIDVLKKRLVGYSAVELSLIEAIESNDSEDIEDALVGFNSVVVKFSENINKLLTLSDTILAEYIGALKVVNSKSESDILYSFVLAALLIIFSVYKLAILQNKIKQELYRAEKAEAEQKLLQEQLVEYNNNLEEEIAKKTNELYTEVYTNSITGLANRNKLLEDIRVYKFKQFALLNIDNFQKFNDVYGEEFGNKAILLTGNFLKDNVENLNMNVYHVGGDEFVYALKNSKDEDSTNFLKQIELLLSKYSKKVFSHKESSFSLIMSSGIDFSAKEKMLAYADMALKNAKKNNLPISIFSEDKKLEETHQDDLKCKNKLIRAFETDGVISYFQPIVPIQDTSLPTKYESLVRIVEENGKIIPPFRFLEVAKQNRVYYKITKRVVINTLSTIKEYKIPCSLNISMKDIENEKTLKWLYIKLDNFDYNNLLTVELLETEEFKDYKLVFDFCTKIRTYGIKIALDDFGSGYANFTHILNLPIDYIKIDSSLISNIDRDHNSKIMVETIVGLAKKLKVQTIAEFVSSKEILDVVKEIGVDYSQGYYTGKPEPIEKHLT